MRRFILFILVTFSICCVRASSTTDTLALLHRDTWSFSAKEIKALNEVSSSDMVIKLAATITNETDYADGILMEFKQTIEVNDNYEDWTKFKFIDLNGDAIAEIVVYISHGRQPGGSLDVLSRKSGSHYCDTVSCDNDGMRFWPADNQALIVGCEELYSGATVDPYRPFKLLYAWTGTNCLDVSVKHRSFYERQVIPELTNVLFQAYQSVIRGKTEDLLLAEAVQWAFTADKLNEMFPELSGMKDLIKKANDLLNALPMEDVDHPLLVNGFRNVRERIRLKIGVRP